ncbi:MAG TPA: ATP-binding protein, partial [Paracoccus sp. (in: a-proteobacteria)]|nr:ATP-binding protein [Paracoccus sp. (in: a-proteobacteria)]
TLIQISDDGPGVPKNQLDLLGRRGLRLDETTGGDGLGLAIVADILEAAQGRIIFRNGAPGLIVTVALPSA